MESGARLPIVDDGVAQDAELVEIQLGHLCNNRCVFCSSGQATQRGLARPMETEPVLQALDRARARRARKVTFLGGEPTLQAAFLPALRHATALGFEEIEIFTNGVKAARRSFVDEVASIGRFSWRFSLQGGNEVAHDRAVAKPGAWKRICRAMQNVGRHGHPITANACINEESYRSLPDYVELVRRYGVVQLHIDVVRPSSAGDRSDAYLRQIMPRHAEMAPFFDEMLQRFDAWDPDFDVNVGNFPYCVLPQWADRIHHGGQQTLTLASDLDNALSSKDKYSAQHRDKVHGPGCSECVFRGQCSGVFDAYARIHGTEDLVPLDRAALAARDPRRNALRWHAEPIVSAFSNAPPPPEWEPAVVRAHTRRVSVQFGELSLDVHRSVDGPGLVVARTQTTVTTATLRGPVSAPALRAFVGWARQVHPGQVAAPAVWVGAAMGRERLARGRAMVRRVLERADGQLCATKPNPQWPGVLAALTVAGESVPVELRVGWSGVPRVWVRSRGSAKQVRAWARSLGLGWEPLAPEA